MLRKHTLHATTLLKSSYMAFWAGEGTGARQWQQHGSLREYLIRCLEHPDIRMGRAMLIAALQEVLQLVHMLSRAGIVLGDLKLDNMLVDAHGHVTLSDVDGAGLLEEGLLRTTQLVAAQAAAQAAAMCLDPVAAEAAVWRAADLVFTQEPPTMITDAFAPLEIKVFQSMCGASHQHLVGASLGALLAALQPVLLSAGRTACFYFVTELHGLAMGLQTLAHLDRPDLQGVWSQLEAIGARWV
eukprot:XP_001693257.1 predicted protein [Chlamydomonas reinhardtii]